MGKHRYSEIRTPGELLTGLIDYILKDTQIMSTIEEVNATVAELAETQVVTQGLLATLDAKLDEIRAFIDGLQVGHPVTQEQLDALCVAIDAAKAVAVQNKVATEAALAETDALDGSGTPD